MRALRPAADDARALAEGRAPGHRRLHAREGRRRRLLPEAHPAGRPGLRARPRGSSSRPAATPTRSARPRSPSWPGRRRWARSPSTRGRSAARTSTTPTSCASTSTRSRARTSPTPCGSPARRAGCSATSATPASRRPPAAAASTSTSGSSRAGPSPTSATRPSPSAASSSAGCPGEVTTNWWKEERGERIFVDYNQNARDRTIASAYSVRPKPGAPVSAPVTWDELPDVAPEDFTVATMPARFAEVGDLHARDRRRRPLARSRCWTSTSATRPRAGRHALPARLPEDAGRAQAGPALARPRPAARLARTGAPRVRRLRQLPRAAPGGRRRRRRHDRPDVAVRRLVEVDDDGRVVARPLALARLPVDPGRPHALGDGRRRPARGRSASRGPGGTSRRGSPST